MKAAFGPCPATRFRSIRSAAALYVATPCIPRSSSLHRCRRGTHYICGMCEAKEHFVRTLQIVALALVLGLEPIGARAEIVSVPPAAPPSSAEALPPPTVLRGSPPSAVRPIPFPPCPPGSIPAPDVGCVAPAGSDYAGGWANYAYLT